VTVVAVVTAVAMVTVVTAVTVLTVVTAVTVRKLIPKLGKSFEMASFGWIFHQSRSFIGSDDAN
jgi:hypothetical protein